MGNMRVRLGINTNDTSNIKAPAENVPLKVYSAVGQTADLQQWQGLLETIAIDKDGKFSGNLYLPNTTQIGSITYTKISYLSDVTSNIQAQVNSKAPTASPTFTGKVTLASSTAGAAALNIPQATAPTSPNNGDVWITSAGVFAHVNDATVDLVNGGQTMASDEIILTDVMDIY